MTDIDTGLNAWQMTSNHPSRSWDWYFRDSPITAVDVGISTHAHFDHDALHLANRCGANCGPTKDLSDR
jgi:hypothetical protein